MTCNPLFKIFYHVLAVHFNGLKRKGLSTRPFQLKHLYITYDLRPSPRVQSGYVKFQNHYLDLAHYHPLQFYFLLLL